MYNFFAEVYSPWTQTMQDVGFDFTYEKELYDKLSDGNLDNLRAYIRGMTSDYMRKSSHYVENHDEKRAPMQFGSNLRADAAAMVSMTLPGMRFYFMGQELGYHNRLDVHLRRAVFENPSNGVDIFYNKLFSIINMDVFHEGTWTYLSAGNSNDSWRLVAWKWVLGNSKVLCVINYSTDKGSGSIILSDATPINGNDTIPVTDLLTGNNKAFNASPKSNSREFLPLIHEFFLELSKYLETIYWRSAHMYLIPSKQSCVVLFQPWIQ